MARTNNLSNFLTDVAGAIKEKKGDNTNILAANFDTEILALPSQGTYQNKQLNITTNGNYDVTPDEGYDAMDKLRLSVEIEGKEDLDDVLNTQDQKIAELEAALENKTAGPAILSIYCQETEPSKKDGIWLQTNKKYDEIIEDFGIYGSEEWNYDKISSLATIPYDFYAGSAVAVGTDIYLFGSSSNSNYAYKYNTLTNTYTKLTDMPYSFNQGSAVAVGTDIYILFGSGTSPNYAYKYDILTNTYTRLTNVPYSVYNGVAVVIGTDIYILCGNSSTYAYKYDILTNTYTRLTNVPYSFSSGAAVAVGTDIYLFGSYNPSGTIVKAYKYDTVTDTYTRLTDMPYKFYSGAAVAVGTSVYLFGDVVSGCRRYTYKYNVSTDTYTRLTDTPYDFYSGAATQVGIDIYLLGGAANKRKVLVMSMLPKEYTDKSIVIANNKANRYETVLIPTEVTNQLRYAFNDVFYYEDSEFDTMIPTYYGDGTQWIKFKN